MIADAGDAQTVQLRRLIDVTRVLTYDPPQSDVFHLAIDRAAELLGAEQVLLMVTNEAGVLVATASRGVDPALAPRLQAPLNERVVQHLAEVLGAGPERFLGAPLVVAGTIKGLLFVVRARPSLHLEHDEWLLSALADQAALALERQRLQEISEFREQLIAIAGHDLRGPLTTISVAAQLLVHRPGLGTPDSDLARKIAAGATLAARLVDQLLDLTRSRLGDGIPVERSPCDLEELCTRLIDELGLVHPDRPVRLRVQGEASGVWDRDRMYQLLSNLLGNAVQHGAPGTPIALRLDGQPSEVVLEVANDGEPIPPDLLPVLFDAYRKQRRGSQARSRGLGLGLFIAQQIALSHGGAITVASSRDAGTMFRVRLPRAPPPIASRLGA